MNKFKLTEREKLLAEEKALKIDLDNIVDQMAKTIHNLSVVRQKLMSARHLYVITEDSEKEQIKSKAS